MIFSLQATTLIK